MNVGNYVGCKVYRLIPTHVTSILINVKVQLYVFSRYSVLGLMAILRCLVSLLLGYGGLKYKVRL